VGARAAYNLGMEADVDHILFTREVIEERVKELAAEVMGVYRERDLTVAVTLDGAFIFAADLVRHLAEDVEVVFVRCSSYEDGSAPVKAPEVQLPPHFAWAGRHVLLVEDVVDTGRTVQSLSEAVRAAGAASLRVCAFLDKPSRRETAVTVDFVGFTVTGPEFLVGYGLDHAGRYRNLPYVGALRAGLLER
jgi:hypoxanthine phosphoribosyltransferase